MYWFFFILGGIILTIILIKHSLNNVRNERINNFPMTDIPTLQNRFQNKQDEFTIFTPAMMTVMAYISPNGGAMSWFSFGEIDINNGVPNEIKEYINNIGNSRNLPNYIVSSTFNANTPVGPYLMIDFFSKNNNKTLSIGFLNQQNGYDLRNSNLANMFVGKIKEELENLK